MNFTTIDEFCSYLETKISTSKRDYSITNDLKIIHDSLKDENAKKIIQYEMLIWDFVLTEGESKPIHSTTKEDGTDIWSYPNFCDLDEAGYQYLFQRIKKIKNDFVVARYNQILWNSPKKHLNYAKNAIDAYLNILNNINHKEASKDDYSDVFEIFKNGFSLSIQSKYKVDNYKRLAQFFLFNRRKFHEDTKVFILIFMNDQLNLKKNDFKGTLQLLNRLGSRKKNNHSFRKIIYETGLSIARKCGENTAIWNKRIGDTMIRMAESRLNDKTRIVPLSFYKQAIPYYKLARANKKVKETEEKYFQLKKELKLSKVYLPFPEKEEEEFNNHLNIKVKELLEKKPNEIIAQLMIGDNIFPNIESIKKIQAQTLSAFTSFATTVKFDINKNIESRTNKNKSKIKSNINEHYDFYIKVAVLPYLHKIFIEGMLKNKIIFSELSLFFLKETWLGQDLIITNTIGELIKYNWLTMIAPSLLEYFLQTESALKSPKTYNNYILCIDSLTLKFEGALRDFAGMLEIPTTVTGKRGVLREKYIEELLTDEQIKKYFNEDDLLLFNYLFVSKDGMNLRNNIAHCFFRFNNYSYPMMHLLICAFLRLGKYKLNNI